MNNFFEIFLSCWSCVCFDVRYRCRCRIWLRVWLWLIFRFLLGGIFLFRLAYWECFCRVYYIWQKILEKYSLKLLFFLFDRILHWPLIKGSSVWPIILVLDRDHRLVNFGVWLVYLNYVFNVVMLWDFESASCCNLIDYDGILCLYCKVTALHLEEERGCDSLGQEVFEVRFENCSSFSKHFPAHHLFNDWLLPISHSPELSFILSFSSIPRLEGLVSKNYLPYRL